MDLKKNSVRRYVSNNSFQIMILGLLSVFDLWTFNTICGQKICSNQFCEVSIRNIALQLENEMEILSKEIFSKCYKVKQSSCLKIIFNFLDISCRNFIALRDPYSARIRIKSLCFFLILYICAVLKTISIFFVINFSCPNSLNYK